MAGLLSRLLRRTETRSTPSAVASWPGFATAFGAGRTASGAYVSPHLAENLATVLACVNAISSTLASCTPRVYRITPNGREELPAHPVAAVLRRPNEDQTWPDLVEWGMPQTLLHGNALFAIGYDAAGRVVSLRPLPWGRVQMMRLTSGRIAYDVVQDTGVTRRYFAEEVFHLRDRTDDGLIGRSRISRAREALGNAQALQDWSSSMWRNGLKPSGWFTASTYLKEPDRVRAQAIIDSYAGSMNAGRPVLLEGGWKWETAASTLADAETLASRRFSVEEICRVFGVPPPIVQDLSHGTFTNSREAARWFAQFTLAPWARKIEAEFRRSVFSAAEPNVILEIDMSDLLRGDAEARWQSHKIAVEAGILDPDEVREIEGWNPRPAKAPAP
jgi:HK97 family phage portal protein